jgi:FMN phosphatase YigB (HAD superfamily)
MSNEPTTGRGERPDMSRIRAVLFDVDGTLYAQWPVRLAMALEMAAVSAATALSGGLRVPRVIAAFRTTRESLRTESDGRPIVQRQYAAVAEALGCSPDDVQRIVEDWMYRRPLKWLRYCRRRGVVGVLDWLDGRGLAKGVLSDYPAHDKLAALGLGDRFDVVMSTVDPDIDAFKPSPRGFALAASRWGLEPSTVLYVGDRPDVDVAGARAAGMPCAVLTRRPVAPDAIRIGRLSELERVLDGRR